MSDDNKFILPKRRKGLRIAIKTTLIVAVIAFLTVVAVGIANRKQPESSPVTNKILPDTNTTTTPQQALSSQSTTVPPQTVIANSSSSEPSIAGVEAKLCTEYIKNAEGLAKLYNSMFFDAWKDWRENFYGRWDTQEAQDNKQWYKNYIQKLFADLINRVDPNMKATCHSSTSLADILVMPNYNAW